MKTSATQQLGQSQQQRLLPLQVRVGRLLEMNTLELEQEIERAVEELPALEVKPVENEGDGEQEFTETSEQLQAADYGSEDDIPSGMLSKRNSSGNERFLSMESGRQGKSLTDMLTDQMEENHLTDDERLAAQFIIGSIDSNGYMTRSVSAIADDIHIQTGHEIPVDEVRRVWQLVRRFEPAGIGAVDLRDSLLLQLQTRSQRTPAMDKAQTILRDYFDLFALRHFDRISRATGFSDDELKEAIDVIRHLNPKPGAVIGGEPLEEASSRIIPDFKVENNNGVLTLRLLNNIPELELEQSFTPESEAELLAGASKEQRKSARSFIKTHRDEAKEYIKLLQTRQTTLFRIMKAVVDLQSRFFLTGESKDIKPMILKDVAAVTGDNISVISRAMANKYVATDSGTYPVKHFFNERRKPSGDSSGEDATAREVSGIIRELIASEEKHHPLTDEALVVRLKEKGYEIARRTVAKYREKMGLPVARLRKEI